MEENKLKKIDLLKVDELDGVAGGRIYSDWVCPDCGHVIKYSHSYGYKIDEHREMHAKGYVFNS